jgi:hypothetical protein
MSFSFKRVYRPFLNILGCQSLNGEHEIDLTLRGWIDDMLCSRSFRVELTGDKIEDSRKSRMLTGGSTVSFVVENGGGRSTL